MVFVFCSCHKKEDFVCVSLNDFDSLRTAGYDVSADNVFSNIRALMGSDTANSIADIHARRHYRKDMDIEVVGDDLKLLGQWLRTSEFI